MDESDSKDDMQIDEVLRNLQSHTDTSLLSEIFRALSANGIEGLTKQHNTLSSSIMSDSIKGLNKTLETASLKQFSSPSIAQKAQEEIRKSLYTQNFNSVGEIFKSLTESLKMTPAITDYAQFLQNSVDYEMQSLRESISTNAAASNSISALSSHIAQLEETRQELLMSSQSSFSQLALNNPTLSSAISESLASVRVLEGVEGLSSIQSLFDTATILNDDLRRRNLQSLVDSLTFYDTAYLESSEEGIADSTPSKTPWKLEISTLTPQQKAYLLDKILQIIIGIVIPLMIAHGSSVHGNKMLTEIQSLHEAYEEQTVALYELLENFDIVRENSKTHFIRQESPLRSQPYRESDIITRLNPNQEVYRFKQEGTWSYIEYFDHIEEVPKTGWINTPHLRVIR